LAEFITLCCVLVINFLLLKRDSSIILGKLDLKLKMDSLVNLTAEVCPGVADHPTLFRRAST